MQIMKNILKYSVICGLFLVPFIPFIVPGAMFFPFITGKGFTFRILIEIIFGLFVILSSIDTQYRPKLSAITKSVLFFTMAILIADIFGVNPYKSLWSNYERMEGFVLISHLFLYYIVASSVFNTKSRWVEFWNVSIVTSVIMSIYGTLQLAGKLTINQGGVRVDGTFGNASYFAIYLIFNIFLSLYFLADSTKAKWQKWLYGLIAIFETVILYFTATRGAILGLIGGLFLVGLLVAWKERENKYIRKIAYVFLGSIIALVLLFSAVRYTSFVQRSPVLSRFSSLSFTEFQSQGRYYVWPMAIKGIIERPIIGWGQEGFNFVFNKYYDPRMYGQEQWFDRTHDVFLDWLIAGGLLGFLAYASMFVALFYYIWRKQSKLKLLEKSILTGMIAGYIFHNIFVFDNLISYILFFSVLAYMHSINSSEAGIESLGKFHTKVFSSDIINYIIVPTVIIITICAVYFVNVPAIKANQILIQAITPQNAGVDKNFMLFKQVYDYNSFGSDEATEQLLQITSQIAGASTSQVSDIVKQEFYNLAKSKILDKIARTPHDARYLVFAGSFFDQFRQYDDAIKYLELALIESPKKQGIYFELGSAYVNKGNPTKAFEEFKTAYNLEPNSPESQIIYTVGAIYTKNIDVLNQMSKILSQDKIVYDNRILKAYSDIGDFNMVVNILNYRLEKDPNNTQYELSLASAYANLGQKQKAVDIINEMIAKDPNFKDQGNQYIKQIKESQ